ncbi:MAG: hypothetical protein GY827_09755 [Cytophagales bacterium]|nr:hypothetical protein [Cytophagales bacterium]
MTNRIMTFVLLLMTLTTFAQTPNMFNYQAVIRDEAGTIVSNTEIGLRLSILKGTTNGQNVHQGDYTVTTDNFGVVSVKIGGPDVSIGDFSTIDWGSDSYFLKTEIDLEGGNNYIEMGVTQFISVPYAIHSSTSDTAKYAMSVANVDDADANPQNEIQSLRLKGDTLFLSNSNFVLLSGIGANVDFYNCYGSDNASWWNQGNIANYYKVPDGRAENRTVGSGVSTQDWVAIFNEVGFSFSTPTGKKFPKDNDIDLNNIPRYSYYQTSTGYFGIDFVVGGSVTNDTELQTTLSNKIANMDKFSLRVYQNDLLLHEYDKSDIEVKIFDSSFDGGKTIVILKFNGKLNYEEINQELKNMRYEICIKK